MREREGGNRETRTGREIKGKSRRDIERRGRERERERET